MDLPMVNTDADEVWHLFILDTKGYKAFCDEYVGVFIHHNPYVEKVQVDTTMLDEVLYPTSRKASTNADHTISSAWFGTSSCSSSSS